MAPSQSSPAFPFVADVAFQSGDIVFATDRFGCVVYWNEEAEAVSGYPAKEVLGKPYALACRMEPEVAPLDLSAILAGRDFAGAVRCHSRSGADVALYLFATAGRDSTGQPAGVVFVGRDVSGLWQAEEVAQASADKYRVLFENTLDAVAIADMDGKVLEANPACLRLYGYTAEELKGGKLTNVAAPEDRNVAAAVLASLAAGRQVAKTIRVRRKDGTRFVVELAASVAMVGGERRILSVTRDVTDRFLSEQARSQSERMYRAVFESANDAVFIESVDGRILDVNRNGCVLLGYSREELLSKRVSDLVPPDARSWLPRVTDAILRDGTFRAEAVRVHRDGHLVPVEISASTMELDGRTAVLSIARDITERKKAEKALRESEAKFRDVSEQSPNMIFINARGRVMYANQKSTDVMGYTREEFYAPDFDFMRLIAPESAEQIKAVYARHARGEEVEPYEYSLVTKDGRRIESIITTRLIDYDGAKAILGIVTDITERFRADRALRQEKERSQTYLALAGVILVALDSSGTITLLNRRGCQVLGVTEAEALGRNWFDNYVPQRSRAEVKATFALLMEGRLEPIEHYENPVLTTSGAERLVAWHNALLRDEAGRVTGTLSSGEDITDRKAAERSRLESERHYHTALDAMHDPIHVADANLRIVMVNQAFLRWLTEQGIDHSVLGKTIFDAFPFLPAKVREEYRCVFESGRPLVTEEETTIAGRTYFTETTKVPVTEGDKVVRVLTVVRDTTERRTAERALRESEEKYRGVVELASDGICIVQEGRLRYVNPRLAEMVGYKPDELVGREFMEHVHPDDRQTVADRYRRRLAGEAVPSTYSVRFLPRGGGEVSAEANVRMATYDGAPAEIVLVRDVTERARAEQTLRESEEKFRSLSEQSPNMIFINRGGRVVYANQTSSDVTGYTREELYAPDFDFMKLVAPESVKKVRSTYERHARGEDVETYEHTLVAKDGRRIESIITTKLIEYEGSRAILGIVTDITERRRSEEALRESEENFRTLAEGIRDGVATLDLEGRITFINEAPILRSGRPREWWLGRHYLDTVPPEYRERLSQLFAAALKGEKVDAYEFSYPSADGRIVHIEGSAAALTRSGKLVGVVIVHRDVTERKAAEQTLRDSEERYRRLLEASPDGVAVYQDGVVVLANRIAAVLLGYGSATELIGRPAASLVSPEDLPGVEERMELLRAGGAAGSPLRVRFVSRTGGAVPAEVVGAATTWRGKPAVQVMVRPMPPRPA